MYEVVLVRYALERLLYRLSISDHNDRFVLKGGMLLTLWIEGGNRETRDADFLGFGDASTDNLKATFAEIMAIDANDGLIFDAAALAAMTIREDMEYEGVRLRTAAFLEKSRIPVTIDIGFGDAIAAGAQPFAYPSLLGMETPRIRTYPPATVVAEKFQAMVTLGVANGRMKDYFDLWAIARAVPVSGGELEAAIRATFERRRTAVPSERPPGLSKALSADEVKQRQWRAYAQSIDLPDLSLEEVVDAAWALVGPACSRIASFDDE
ncbi:nucleotidyl transferase AbiEii/AbiGii toxin family protein [uncultured Roseibium sp.]|uniref:nucleotidyl transferase AbiEii/AbiGii toxin family protein n=1 Tax=uncultured Roseibium sp. TaxID=1936171 RepID=UPI00261484AF|nr:nucleotidyl transferase AbiEii/AbiGii toxin family protein [uncultured Roseibium sp.]